MPGVNGAPADYLQQQIQQVQSDLIALGQQNQYVVVDQNLKLRVLIGLLPSGDFGILLSDPNTGGTQELIPGASAFTSGVLICTSTTPASTVGSPTVNATIGASKDAKITLSAVQVPSASTSVQSSYLIGTRTSGPTPPAGSVTSFTATAIAQFGQTYTGAPPEVPCTTVLRLSQMGLVCAPGAWTFGLQFSTSIVSSGADWSRTYLEIQPV